MWENDLYMVRGGGMEVVEVGQHHGQVLVMALVGWAVVAKVVTAAKVQLGVQQTREAVEVGLIAELLQLLAAREFSSFHMPGLSAAQAVLSRRLLETRYTHS
jgi:transcriptional regulator GlxA family with amidase domain